MSLPNQPPAEERDHPAASNRDGIPFPWAVSNTYQWIFAFVTLGFVVRLVRYLVRFPLTGDEAKRAVNLLGASYAQLTQPLLFHEVAPIPFLWIELFLTKHLGFNEYSLRLLAITCGLASLVLFVHLARRVLSGSASVLAVGIFAVSHVMIRYSNEAKQYSLDLFVALVLIALIVEWWHAPARVAWLWTLALFTPVALVLSFPSLFVAGAIGAAFAVPVWRQRDHRARWAFGLFAVLLAGSFLVLLRYVIGPQYSGVPFQVASWQDYGAFPPIAHPFQLPFWLFRAFAGSVMPYPVGGHAPWSSATLVLFVIGLFVLWKNRSWLVTTTLAMIALGLAAAALRRYPFGYEPRIVLYLAPSICLTAGAGAVECISWIRQAHWQARALRWLTYLLFFGLGFGELVLEVAKPHKGSGTEMHRGFARWFWKEHPDMQTVFVDWDMNLDFYTGSPQKIYLEAAYPCYRAMYDRPHKPAASTAPTNSLRCVFIHMEDATRNDVEFNAWMSKMLADYTLTAHYTYHLALASGGKTERGVYEAYYFTRREPTEPPSTGQK